MDFDQFQSIAASKFSHHKDNNLLFFAQSNDYYVLHVYAKISPNSNHPHLVSIVTYQVKNRLYEEWGSELERKAFKLYSE